ncbi:MAG: acetate/propionate family kinase [Gammaproteobacteria bacterium]|nr:acetate/propionate family kinase [Gammaproteobacteria bacterium]
MTILTINAGSSSLRLSLFASDDDGLVQLAEAHHQDIGSPDHLLLADFIALVDAAEITLIVHRVVHGGAGLTTPSLIDARIEAQIEQLIPLAPLHNPPALEWIRVARRLLGAQVPQVAVFDTAFYRSLPEVATTYALPHELCQRYGIRRYGFHGIAHRAMWQHWWGLKQNAKQSGRVISVQLGSGCSITAIEHGVPVDTSMGFSPLEGLVMATRSGDLDPGVVTYLQRQTGMSVEALDDILNKQSGLFGISGESNDMRVLLDSDNPQAVLAVNLYCYRVRKYIGAYLAVLGGADAILFGGGVGENSSLVRTKILQGMEWLGVELDPVRNDTVCHDAGRRHHAAGKAARISVVASQVDVWVIAVNEALMMVLDAIAVFKKGRVSDEKGEQN